MPSTAEYFCTMTILKRCRWACWRNGSNVLNVFASGNNLNNHYSSSLRRHSNSVAPHPGRGDGAPPSSSKLPHTPVLVSHVVDFLQPENCDVMIDMTFGAGGHTRKLLEKSKTVKILCLDRDPVGYAHAQTLQNEYPDQVVPLRGKFSDLPQLLKVHGYTQNSIDAMLFDFGCSSMQFDDSARGFALSRDGPLDMRMDGAASIDGFTAADVLAYAREDELDRIFRIYGDENQSKKIARAIAQTRFSCKPITRTHELRDLVATVLDGKLRTDKMGRFSHPSTKVFQALRIYVNNELNEINHAMVLARSYLKIGGIVVTIAFHSLEDTIVKSHIIGNSDYDRGTLPLKFFNCNTTFEPQSLVPIQRSCWKAINKHVITPSPSEVDSNPRSRSAKLRAAMKVE